MPSARLLLFPILLLLLAMPAVSAQAARPDLQQTIFRIQDAALSALVNIQPITETYTRGERQKRSSIGSGFLVDTQGHIVTNFHVAGRAKTLMVTLSNKERVEAELIGEDPLTDLAVIRIDPEIVERYGLEPLRFGSSSDLEVGQFVLALGSPLALARTMTFGVVSNAERYLPEGMTLPSGERTGDFNTWIQTDAAINPGNSGGPLINLNGQVVGVNSRGASFADNIGFAIPSDTTRVVATALIETGSVRRSYAGISFQALKDWDLLFGLDKPRGVLVSSLAPGGPGIQAGLMAGDIILAFDEDEYTVRFDEELPGLYQRLADSPVGSTISLRVLRRGSELDLKLTTQETGKLSGDKFEAGSWGFTVQGITDQMVYQHELEDREGVLVEGVKTGSPAHRGRLSRNLVIEAIDGKPIVDLADFQQRYAELTSDAGKNVLLRTRRHKSKRWVLIQPKSKGDPRP